MTRHKNKQFYFLCTVQVIFSIGEELHTAFLNVVRSHEHAEMNLDLIGKIQTAAQLRFAKELGMEPDQYQIRNVVITFAYNCGLMTEAEFNQNPRANVDVAAKIFQ